VERYRGLLEKPASHTPFSARLHVEFASTPGKAETFDGAFDLDEVAAAGVVARQTGDKIRLMIGTPRTPLWPSWDSPSASPHVFFALSVPIKAPSSAARDASEAPGVVLGPSDLVLDLLIPRIAILSGTLASDRRVEIVNVSASAGGPIRLTLMAKLRDAARTFRVKIELETFVRDGADPRIAGKKGTPEQ
jgi:hypothetical protein